MFREAILCCCFVSWIIPTAILQSAEDAQPEAASNPYASVLAENRIEATRDGITAYLKSFVPSDAERQRRAEKAIQLIDQLGAKRFQTREDATTQLLLMPEFPRDAMLQAAGSKDPEIRWRADQLLAMAQKKLQSLDSIHIAVCRTIQRLKIKGVAVPLLKALSEFEGIHVLVAAGDALAATALVEDVPVLREYLSGSPKARVAAAQSLGAVLGDKAVPELKKLLRDEFGTVRLAAARALANLGNRESLPVLLTLLDHGELNNRIASVQVLRSLTGQQFGYLAYEKPEKRKAATTNWQNWVATKGDTVKLHFPIKPIRIEVGNTLVLLYSQSKLIELDPNGKQIRELGNLNFPWSVKRLDNGNVLVGSYRGKFVAEYDPSGKEVWRKDGLPGGVFGLQRLDNGNTMLACHTNGIVLEVDPAGKIVWQVTLGSQAFDVQRLENGNTLVAKGNGKQVVEVDRQGKVVWKIDGLLIPRSAERLVNGNTLISDYRANRVDEYDRSGKKVWSYATLQGPYSAHRLAGGRTLISDRAGVKIIDRGGKIVWQKAMTGIGRAIRY
ncbi:MAG: HEAT repeat domain-containing protein [Planctomycetes bacterium]|nr:HEAT repeat domain-containing protein [Planctomycetota bacterium]